MNHSGMMTSERQVAEFLDSIGLPWEFEFPVFVYDERRRPRVWTPDFYIPKLGIYIEVCGTEKFKYEYRKKIYQDNDVPVIYIHFFKGQRYWRKFLIRRIREVEDQRHSEAMKLIENVPTELQDPPEILMK